MFMNFISWWSELSPWIRYGVAGLFLLISTALLFAGTFWPWGWAVGFVLLIFGGPSSSDKNGYNF